MPTFVLNDETKVNSYGFRIPNKGIDFSRFDPNPVMLDSHINSLATVLGSWEKRVVEGILLKADTVFDSADPNVKPIEEKVNRGFIKGCSMGVMFDWDYLQKNVDDDTWELVKCELMEASLCAVPSNSGSLALFNKDGELIPEDEIKLTMQKLSANELRKINTPNMEKIILSHQALSVLVGLGVTDGGDVASISNALVTLQNKVTDAEKLKTTAEGKMVELQTKLDKQVKLQAETLIDGAITEGKLTAGEREGYLADATANYELTAKLIGKIPGKASLANSILNGKGGATEVKSADDFEKLTVEKQLAFKNENPDAYKALFAK